MVTRNEEQVIPQGDGAGQCLIASGIGLLVAAAFPATRRNQELAETVKEQAEPLTDQVMAAAKEVASNLAEPAGEAVQSLKESATAAVEDMKAEGEGAVADGRQHASEYVSQVRDTAQSAAKDATRVVAGHQVPAMICRVSRHGQPSI